MKRNKIVILYKKGPPVFNSSDMAFKRSICYDSFTNGDEKNEGGIL
ncbi:MAG: hypothetical protein ACLU48_07035 [Clostridiaceae bacterium]